MKLERFITGQRKSVNIIFAMIVGFATIMWVATFLDWAFSLGWDLDRQALWVLPLMVLFAAFVRFVVMAIFKFVGSIF